MSRSVWTILLLGLVALGLLSMAMCMTMMTFPESQAGHLAKLALAVQNKFQADRATVNLRREEGKKFLRVVYHTHKSVGFDLSAQSQEMKEVGTFALDAYDGKDKREIDEVRVTRAETRGRGCWQNTYTAHETVPNPARTAPDLFRPRDGR